MQADARDYGNFFKASLKWVMVIALFFVVTACTSLDSEETAAEEETKLTNVPVEQLYEDASKSLEKENFKDAVKGFQDVERQYPFSPLATRAQVMQAFAYYKDQKYDDSVDTVDRFVRLNPANENVGYMYYLKALNYYEQIADVRRDQKITQQAQDALLEVVLRFPGTDYSRDAKLKLDLVRDHLAGKEMEVGRFYQKQRKYVSAINRYAKVVKEYDTTTHVSEALFRLVEVYHILGIEAEAQKNAAVLGYNYPDSKWYNYAYELVGDSKSQIPAPKSDQPWWKF